MPRLPVIAVCILVCTIVAAPRPATAAEMLELEEVAIWNGPAPGANGDEPTDIPTLTIHRPDPEVANGAAVIIAPGGGYWIHAIDHEGLHVANFLNERGITAFMLTYRLRRHGYEPTDAFADGQRAVRYLRTHAAEYGVDGDRIGVLGFSAGGHLAAALARSHTAGDADADDPVERASSRPDFTILCYTPAPGGEWRPGREFGNDPIDARTPPAFIFHTHGDSIDPASVIDHYQQLREHGVDAEMHIFGGYGPHGTGLGSGDPAIGRWPELAVTWLRKTGWLTDQPRLPLAGRVTIDGEPMLRGWITFTPVDDPHAPVAAYYIHDPSEDDEAGRFTFTEETGPVAGLHRVTIRHIGNEILTRPTLAEEFIHPAPDSPEQLEVNITDETDELDFDLPSNAPIPGP